ncbi:molecular chaperone [Providencia manganoxydans]|uniref:fimbrial biogenesis chaperone n=1 Tax=Providencia manganoxydans TaxID=2923283 RepID=UPI0034E600F3
MRLIAFLFVLFLSINTSNANDINSGFDFYSTRLIYNESDKSGISFSIKNNSKNNYLMQAWISETSPMSIKDSTDDYKYKDSPFIILPPLKKINGYEKMSWRIIQKDRILNRKNESIYYIYIKAIPSFNEDENSKIAINTVLAFKLFYRPNDLEIKKINKTFDMLEFQKEGESLIVRNNSPLYITFDSISIGNKKISEDELMRMVPPNDSQKYLLPKNASGKIQWSLINDLSGKTESIEQDF